MQELPRETAARQRRKAALLTKARCQAKKPVKAGNADTGDADAGDADAGGADAGGADAGGVDAGSADAGDVDAGDVDAGDVDAGDVDVGGVDTGDVDAGNAEAPAPTKGKGKAKASNSAAPAPTKGKAKTSGTNPHMKKFNLTTYKWHRLGDYVKAIRLFGTTDNYTTQIVSSFLDVQMFTLMFCVTGRIGTQTRQEILRAHE
ncbi:hypothetical protein A0H81_05717 [Grifola frondosa]|uniref:Uncharacterized protein n=1 Tax=Grifola frondosa TaxID=5627 RepID=A0A1C7MCA9_GRIFR|nr:hypothetical protein A0H81_05717 [Grifola frondosa]